ncbi:MAG: hypothetical protein QG654_294 [Patescibacteria group bacterium]|nr:hypothetical protein [Patescibacteria group bacterium]
MKKYVCLDCGWIYDESLGVPEKNIAPGTKWAELPDDFKCLECDTLKGQTDMWQMID